MTIEPKDSVKDYYLSLVEEVNELMIQGGEEVDRVLAQTDDEEEEKPKDKYQTEQCFLKIKK